MQFIIRPYGKSELYYELINRGYKAGYRYFSRQLQNALEYSGHQLQDFKRRKTISAKEVEKYIQECGLPRVFDDTQLKDSDDN